MMRLTDTFISPPSTPVSFSLVALFILLSVPWRAVALIDSTMPRRGLRPQSDESLFIFPSMRMSQMGGTMASVEVNYRGEPPPRKVEPREELLPTPLPRGKVSRSKKNNSKADSKKKFVSSKGTTITAATWNPDLIDHTVNPNKSRKLMEVSPTAPSVRSKGIPTTSPPPPSTSLPPVKSKVKQSLSQSFDYRAFSKMKDEYMEKFKGASSAPADLLGSGSSKEVETSLDEVQIIVSLDPAKNNWIRRPRKKFQEHKDLDREEERQRLQDKERLEAKKKEEEYQRIRTLNDERRKALEKRELVEAKKLDQQRQQEGREARLREIEFKRIEEINMERKKVLSGKTMLEKGERNGGSQYPNFPNFPKKDGMSLRYEDPRREPEVSPVTQIPVPKTENTQEQQSSPSTRFPRGYSLSQVKQRTEDEIKVHHSTEITHDANDGPAKPHSYQSVTVVHGSKPEYKDYYHGTTTESPATRYLPQHITLHTTARPGKAHLPPHLRNQDTVVLSLPKMKPTDVPDGYELIPLDKLTPDHEVVPWDEAKQVLQVKVAPLGEPKDHTKPTTIPSKREPQSGYKGSINFASPPPKRSKPSSGSTTSVRTTRQPSPSTTVSSLLPKEPQSGYHGTTTVRPPRNFPSEQYHDPRYISSQPDNSIDHESPKPEYGAPQSGYSPVPPTAPVVISSTWPPLRHDTAEDYAKPQHIYSSANPQSDPASSGYGSSQSGYKPDDFYSKPKVPLSSYKEKSKSHWLQPPPISPDLPPLFYDDTPKLKSEPMKEEAQSETPPMVKSLNFPSHHGQYHSIHFGSDFKSKGKASAKYGHPPAPIPTKTLHHPATYVATKTPHKIKSLEVHSPVRSYHEKSTSSYNAYSSDTRKDYQTETASSKPHYGSAHSEQQHFPPKYSVSPSKDPYPPSPTYQHVPYQESKYLLDSMTKTSYHEKPALKTGHEINHLGSPKPPPQPRDYIPPKLTMTPPDKEHYLPPEPYLKKPKEKVHTLSEYNADHYSTPKPYTTTTPPRDYLPPKAAIAPSDDELVVPKLVTLPTHAPEPYKPQFSTTTTSPIPYKHWSTPQEIFFKPTKESYVRIQYAHTLEGQPTVKSLEPHGFPPVMQSTKQPYYSTTAGSTYPHHSTYPTPPSYYPSKAPARAHYPTPSYQPPSYHSSTPRLTQPAHHGSTARPTNSLHDDTPAYYSTTYKPQHSSKHVKAKSLYTYKPHSPTPSQYYGVSRSTRKPSYVKELKVFGEAPSPPLGYSPRPPHIVLPQSYVTSSPRPMAYSTPSYYESSSPSPAYYSPTTKRSVVKSLPHVVTPSVPSYYAQYPTTLSPKNPYNPKDYSIGTFGDIPIHVSHFPAHQGTVAPIVKKEFYLSPRPVYNPADTSKENVKTSSEELQSVYYNEPYAATQIDRSSDIRVEQLKKYLDSLEGEDPSEQADPKVLRELISSITGDNPNVRISIPTTKKPLDIGSLQRQPSLKVPLTFTTQAPPTLSTTVSTSFPPSVSSTTKVTPPPIKSVNDKQPSQPVNFIPGQVFIKDKDGKIIIKDQTPLKTSEKSRENSEDAWVVISQQLEEEPIPFLEVSRSTPGPARRTTAVPHTIDKNQANSPEISLLFEQIVSSQSKTTYGPSGNNSSASTKKATIGTPRPRPVQAILKKEYKDEEASTEVKENTEKMLKQLTSTLSGLTGTVKSLNKTIKEATHRMQTNTNLDVPMTMIQFMQAEISSLSATVRDLQRKQEEEEELVSKEKVKQVLLDVVEEAHKVAKLKSKLHEQGLDSSEEGGVTEASEEEAPIRPSLTISSPDDIGNSGNTGTTAVVISDDGIKTHVASDVTWTTVGVEHVKDDVESSQRGTFFSNMGKAGAKDKDQQQTTVFNIPVSSSLGLGRPQNSGAATAGASIQVVGHDDNKNASPVTQGSIVVGSSFAVDRDGNVVPPTISNSRPQHSSQLNNPFLRQNADTTSSKPLAHSFRPPQPTAVASLASPRPFVGSVPFPAGYNGDSGTLGTKRPQPPPTAALHRRPVSPTTKLRQQQPHLVVGSTIRPLLAQQQPHLIVGSTIRPHLAQQHLRPPAPTRAGEFNFYPSTRAPSNNPSPTFRPGFTPSSAIQYSSGGNSPWRPSPTPLTANVSPGPVGKADTYSASLASPPKTMRFPDSKEHRMDYYDYDEDIHHNQGYYYQSTPNYSNGPSSPKSGVNIMADVATYTEKKNLLDAGDSSLQYIKDYRSHQRPGDLEMIVYPSGQLLKAHDPLNPPATTIGPRLESMLLNSYRRNQLPHYVLAKSKRRGDFGGSETFDLTLNSDEVVDNQYYPHNEDEYYSDQDQGASSATSLAGSLFSGLIETAKDDLKMVGKVIKLALT